MNRYHCIILFSTALLGCSSLSRGQSDSLIIIHDTANDSISLNFRDSSHTELFHQSKSPWLAVGLSATLPGLGQIYNENYWKAPVIWGVGGYWIYEWIRQNNKYKDFGDAYAASLVNSPTGNETYKSLRDFYRDDRDRFAWFLGGLYVLNLIDAYVGAHLYDFDVTPDLGVGGRIVPKITATVRFRL